MYLYKAACSDIHVPRQKSAQRSERTPGRFIQRQGTGLSSNHTAGCPRWEGRSNSALELQQLGHFMQIHGYSLLESVGANTTMIYRWIVFTLAVERSTEPLVRDCSYFSLIAVSLSPSPTLSLLPP
ncbi:hypothetical protein G5714_002230 [Onychostoma macrolepis]|uniref:Uncharacterized protein n=1 Tax=Onychostoma macrolepis TaxID=369639 RepID=A0A7J6DEB8_9TELE|nr:hypothetical protein G5714_002230 [Onychostoma macrolepis]